MSGECFPRHPVLCRRYHHHHHPPTPHSPHPRSTTTIATTLAVFATLSMLLCCGAGIAALEQSGRDVLDLIPGLNSSHSTTPSHREALAGVRYTKGSDGYAQALLLEEESNRHISLPDAVVAKALRLLQDHKEVTFLCSLRQEIGDSGTVLALSADRSFYLEIESSGRRNEIRFHYSHDGQVRVEMFPYRLADGQWHKMALTLSGGHVSLFIDCNRIYQRVIPPLDLPRTKGTHSLFLGQRNGQQAMFRGALQDVQIVTQAHGFLLQCPQQDTECHTCANFQDMEQRIQEMSTMYRELTHQLSRAEERLSDLEQCECLQYCHDNGTKRRDGEEWMKDKCNICRCKNGSVECHTQECPAAACSKPVYREGQCCPVCLTNCYFSGKYYDHGEVTSPRVCVTCVCQNGRMVCQRRDTEKTCPKLDCPPHERLEIHGQCCPVCNGTDYCAQGHNCHGNASCINLATKLACQCHPGFDGDGHTCQDVDECLVAGGPKGHHCSANTVCVNTPGSYRCDCEKGHSRLDSYECAGTSHNASPPPSSRLSPSPWALVSLALCLVVMLCPPLPLPPSPSSSSLLTLSSSLLSSSLLSSSLLSSLLSSAMLLFSSSLSSLLLSSLSSIVFFLLLFLPNLLLTVIIKLLHPLPTLLHHHLPFPFSLRIPFHRLRRRFHHQHQHHPHPHSSTTSSSTIVAFFLPFLFLLLYLQLLQPILLQLLHGSRWCSWLLPSSSSLSSSSPLSSSSSLSSYYHHNNRLVIQ